MQLNYNLDFIAKLLSVLVILDNRRCRHSEKPSSARVERKSFSVSLAIQITSKSLYFNSLYSFFNAAVYALQGEQ